MATTSARKDKDKPATAVQAGVPPAQELEKPQFDVLSSINQQIEEAEKGIHVIPQEKKSGDLLSDHDTQTILDRLAKTKNITTGAAAIAVYELSLAGALNAGAPSNQKIEIKTPNAFVEVTKGDIEYVYSSVTNNKYLRRLAEKLATSISEYAERKGKTGDLAEKIKRNMTQEDIEFSPAEEAWLSSFNQKNQDCRTRYSRVAKALDRDYNNRFRSPKVQKKKNTKR